MPKARTRKRGRPKDRELMQRRQEEILDVAARVFAERGFPGTDVQEIADELEVGKGTIYRYFPTKRKLFLAAVDRAMRRLREEVDASAAEAGDPLERIARAVRAYLAFFDANPAFVELLMQERAEFKDRKKPTYFEHREVNEKTWQEVLRELASEHRVRDMPVQRITEVVGDLLYGTIFTNHFAGRRKSFEQQAKNILDIVFHGILTDKERVRRPVHGARTGSSA